MSDGNSTTMQEAFRKALDGLETQEELRRIDRRKVRVLQAALCAAEHSPSPEVRLDKLIYAARKLAQRWCSFAIPGGARPGCLEELRRGWALLLSQLAPLSHEQRVNVLSEMASAMGPGDTRHDCDRARYLMGQAASRPECFAGLETNPWIPWPGPAAFYVHAMEELAGWPPGERQDLHAVLTERWDGQPLGLFQVLGSWLARNDLDERRAQHGAARARPAAAAGRQGRA
jgi:hypothetical protein